MIEKWLMEEIYWWVSKNLLYWFILYLVVAVLANFNLENILDFSRFS